MRLLSDRQGFGLTFLSPDLMPSRQLGAPFNAVEFSEALFALLRAGPTPHSSFPPATYSPLILILILPSSPSMCPPFLTSSPL